MEKRILIYAPTGSHAAQAAQLLQTAGIDSCACGDMTALLRELDAGAGAVAVAQDALKDDALRMLGQYIAAQPEWSDLPVLVLTRPDAGLLELEDIAVLLGNAIFANLSSSATFISTARSALRARASQYRVKELNRRKDEFLASLGHELRNPLAPIRNAMQVMKQMYPANQGITQLRGIIERQIVHLTRVIDDLLDVSRITSGRVKLQKEKVTLSSVISHAVEICRPMLDGGKHRLSISQPEREIHLHADPTRVVQSVSNILSNAAKYTTKPGEIVLKAEVRGHDLVLSVKDNGIGLDDAVRVQLFEMFAKTNTAHDPAPGGLGVGLALAKRFTEMHGGTIRAVSDGPGHGSEFILTMPIVVTEENDPAAARATEIPRASSSGTVRVLVVDDNRDGADTLRILLESEGFAVTAAYNGLQAVEAARTLRPDAVLMDIGLPDIDGYEAVRRIRSQPDGDRIKVIALTGWGHADAKRLAAEAGADHHLVKPVNFEMLREHLAKAET